MTFLQKRAIIKVLTLIDFANKKYAASFAENPGPMRDPVNLRLEASNGIDEAKDWLQAIIDDSENDDD